MITTEQSRLNKEFLAQCTDTLIDEASRSVPLGPNPSKDDIIKAQRVTLGAFVAVNALEADMSFPLSVNNTVGKYVLDLASIPAYSPTLETDAGDVRGQVRAERHDSFADQIRNLRERWDNRLVLERVSLAEMYLNGRLEIVLHGDWSDRADHIYWACRVAAEPAILHNVSAHAGIDVADLDNRNGRNDQVVLVNVVEGVELPEALIPSICRPYLFEKKFFGTGEGLLYRREGRVGFDVFPFGTHGKEWTIRRVGVQGTQDSSSQMIQCSPAIVDRITDDECQRFWDWLFGPVGKLVHGRITLNHVTAHLADCDLVQAAIQRISHPPQFVNVAVGPLNL